ncbi:hypothetical protein [Candidatus Harpocratesius sp.]
MIVAFQTQKKLNDPVGKKGFTYLIIFSATAAVFLPLNIVVTLTSLKNSIFYGIVWALAIVSTIYAYLGFIFPFKSDSKEN